MSSLLLPAPTSPPLLTLLSSSLVLFFCAVTSVPLETVLFTCGDTVELIYFFTAAVENFLYPLTFDALLIW